MVYCHSPPQVYWGKSIIGFLIIQCAIGWYEGSVDIVITKIGFPVWEYKAGKKKWKLKDKGLNL